MIVEDQSDLIEFLSRPEIYGDGAAAVERIDTHCAIVFLAGEHAYKLKRAVKFPFLDFSTVTRRHAACETEVRVNRRTAPDIYLGVVPLTRDPRGILAIDGDGEPVDWLVKMRRFDQDGLFDRLADCDALTPALVLDLADEIAAFHAEAEHRPDCGGRDGIAWVVASNDESFAPFLPETFAAARVAHLREISEAAIARHGELLERRRRSGLVRHCHGDLHLRNICLIGDRPTLFDAIEFSDRVACIDVLYDFAFLLMDLEHRGYRPLANLAFNRYLGHTGDLEGLAALPLFLSVRAAVRAHVDAANAARQSDSALADAESAAARHYLDMAVALLDPPPARLIAVGGLSGTGKSSLAQALAPELGAVPGALVLRSDLLRKEIFGVEPTERLGEDAYNSKVTEQVYSLLVERAGVACRAGQAVIADAVFGRQAQRAAIEDLAREAGVPFTGLWLEAPAEMMERRVAARVGDASDATVMVVRQQFGYDVGNISWNCVDASGGLRTTLARARDCLANL